MRRRRPFCDQIATPSITLHGDFVGITFENRKPLSLNRQTAGKTGTDLFAKISGIWIDVLGRAYGGEHECPCGSWKCNRYSDSRSNGCSQHMGNGYVSLLSPRPLSRLPNMGSRVRNSLLVDEKTLSADQREGVKFEIGELGQLVGCD